MHFRSSLSILCFIFTSLTSIAQNKIDKDSSSADRPDSSNNLPVFEKVEIEASFPGGDPAWRKFLERNLRGDVATDNGAPAGIYTVWIQFIVDKEGNISDLKTLTNYGFGMEQEVIRVIKNSPPWQPALLNGRAVKAYRKQPVTFMIEEDGYQILSDEPYVFYAGIDNRIAIRADKVKPNDLRVIVSQGTITPKGDGIYIVHISKPGRVVLRLFNKKDQEIGSSSFEVKSKDESHSVPKLLQG